MAVNIDLHILSVTIMLLVFWTQGSYNELRFYAKSRWHFLSRYSNIENLRLLLKICESSRIMAAGCLEANAILRPAVSMEKSASKASG